MRTSSLSEPKPPPKPTKARRSEHERRLLGESGYEADNDAVPIAIPRSRTRQENMPIPGGGPRPTNTLVGRQSTAPSAFSIGGVYGLAGDLVSMLNNPWGKTAPSHQQGSEHPTKRVKVAHSGPIRKVYTYGEGDSDDIDVLSGDGDERGQRQSPVDRARPGTSVASSWLPKPNPMLRTASSEHETVEAMMDSNNHARQAEEEGRRKRGRPSKKLGMQPRQTQTDAIDLTGSEAPVTGPWRGTARPTKPATQGTSIGAMSRRLETGNASRYFEGAANSGSIATQPNSYISAGTQRSKHIGQLDVQLAEQFMPVNGKRRGSDINVSSDELGGVDDYSRVSRVPPEKRSRQLSPSKERRNDTSPTMISEMEPGNIKATQFTDSGRKQVVQASRPKKQKHDKHHQGTGVDATSITFGKTYLKADHRDLGLVFKEHNTVLEVWYNGQNRTQAYPSFGIPMQGLHRITWAPDCLKMRLDGARRSGHSSPQIDIELTSARDIAELTRELETRAGNVDVVEKDSTYMDRIFKKRLSELAPNRTATHDYIVDDGVEMQVFQRTEQLREENSPVKLQEELGTTKRKTSDSNVIDQLTGRLSRVPGEPAKPVLSRLSQSYRSCANTQGREAAVISSRQTDIDALLHRVNPQNRDSYPTRSTRSTVATDGAAIDKDNPVSYTEELPEELRYSKTHGLGTRWKKPLIYPKAGKKKTTVDFDDLERLDDGQFLNDNLIGFYLRYLQCNLEDKMPDMADKVYWFNTYFFASLTQTARGKRGINYEAVRKWTRGTDIFSYDYAVVPINESAHWYVAIICNLRALNRMPEMGGGDGCSPPPFESFGAAEDVESVPEQSPLQSAGFIDPGKEVDELENHLARGTRESFAELQLEDRNTAGNQDTAVRSEDEMLDDGKVTLVPNSQVEFSSTPPESNTDRDTTVFRGPIAAKTPASQKKGKRKQVQSPRPLDPGQPAIITLDSLGLAHSPTVRALKDYLHAEMQDKRGGMEWEDQQMKGMTAKQIPLQNNYCDCGLFLLGYMDKFVESPTDFVTKLLQRGYDEKKDWPNLNPSAMRSDIRGLIQALHAEQEGERITTKKNSPVKTGAPMRTAEHATQPSPPKVAEKQDPVNGGNIDGVPSIPEQAPTSGTDEVQRTAPATREEALHTALRIDVPDPTPSKIPVHEPPQHNLARHAEPIVDSAPDLPPIVLDSQEEPNPPAGATVRTIQDDDDVPQAQLAEAVMEVPDTPPRPQTRGKPTPDPEPQQVIVSPTRGRKAKEALKPHVHQDREVITIADN